MFDKDLTQPLILEQHEALNRRLAYNHPSRPEVEERLTSLRSGFRGEKTLNYYLSLLPPKKFRIFHDLRLPNGTTFFQIDAFLLSERMGFIIDNKNYAGILTLDKFQLTQEFKDNKKIYQNPISQTHRHIILLRNLLDQNQIPIVPIENLVCFSNPTSIVNVIQGYPEAEKRVCKADNLLRKIDEFERYYKKELLDQKAIGKVKRFVLNKNTPFITDILNTYNIGTKEIIPGVQCPICLQIPMHYEIGNWICPSCLAISKDAHLPALQDYFLLINPWITNSELREFLLLPSPRVATYIFSRLNFPFTGNTKGRIYHPPKPKQ